MKIQRISVRTESSAKHERVRVASRKSENGVSRESVVCEREGNSREQISPSVKAANKTKLKSKASLPAKVFFVGKLKQLIKDTFKINSKEEEKLISRKCPNWCEPEDSTYVNKTIAKRIRYYPEDVEKMKTMTDDEVWAYKDHLDEIGRFYYDDNYHIDTPDLDRVTKEYGIDMSKYIMKDTK